MILDHNEAEKLGPSDESDRLHRIADDAHRKRLDSIKDIVDRLGELDGRTDTTRISRELVRILTKKGVEAALLYVDSQQSTILAEVDAQLAINRDRTRIKLAPLLSRADLYASSGNADKARTAYRELIQRDPTWPIALDRYAWFLVVQSGQSDTHGTAFDALSDATEAHTISSQLHSIEPTNSKAQRLLSVTHRQLGTILATHGQDGDSAKAFTHFTMSLRLSESLLHENSSSAEAISDVAKSHDWLGDFLATRGQPGDADKAFSHFTRALEYREMLQPKANPDVAQSHEALGDFLATRGQPGDADKAFSHFTRALEIRERQILPESPNSIYATRFLSVILNKLGDFLARRGLPGDAEIAFGLYTRALAQSETRHRENPNSAQAKRDESASLQRLGAFLWTRGRPGDEDTTLSYFKRDLALMETLLRSNPTSAQAKRDVSVCLINLGQFLARRGQPGDADMALSYFARDLELTESLLRANPSSAQATRDVSAILKVLGDVLAERGQPGDAEMALGHFTRALSLDDALLQANPGSAQATRNVSASLNTLGEFLVQRGQSRDRQSTLDYFTRSLVLSEALLLANPSSAEAKRDVSVSLNWLADTLARRRQPGDEENAFNHFTRALALRETLLQDNPGSAQAMQDVASSLNWIADFLARRRQPDDEAKALNYFTRALVLREALLQENPRSAQRIRNVSVSLNNLGEFLTLHGKFGDMDVAIEYFKRSLALRETLLQLNPSSTRAARDVSVSLNYLAESLVERGQQGDADTALVYFSRALALRETALRDNPGSMRATQDILESRLKLARFAQLRKDPVGVDANERAIYQLLQSSIDRGVEIDQTSLELYDRLKSRFFQ